MRTQLGPDRSNQDGGTAAPSDAIVCPDLGLRIARDGTWHYRGSPIRRLPLVRLFASVLRRDDDGGYWLVTPVERGRIEVDDVPFTGVELRVAGTGADSALDLRTNLDAWVEIGPDHPLRFDEREGAAVPYVTVRPGLEARVERAPYYQLVDLALDADLDSPGVWSRGAFYALPQPSE